MAQKNLSHSLKIGIPVLLLSIGLIWYQLSKMTILQREELWTSIKSADPRWIIISLCFAILSHISRAYRWRFMLQPLGCTPRLKHSFMAVMIAYFTNTFILRGGELLRAFVLSKLEPVSFDKAFGTIVSERVADLVMLMGIMGAAIILQSSALLGYFEQEANPLPTLVVLILLVIGGLIGLQLLKRSSHPFIIKVRTFGLGVLEGVKSILRMKNNTAFIAHTLFIWGMYVAMFWIMKFTVPGLAEAPIGVILAAFVIGAFSMSATNAGMGLYPLAVMAIFSFFGFDDADGRTFGWLIWGTQTLFNFIIGGICMLIFLFSKKQTKF